MLIDALSEALDEQVIEVAVEKALARLRAGREQHLDRRTQIERELSLIETKLARLVDAITSGGPLDTPAAQVKAEEGRQKALTKELAGVADLARVEIAGDVKPLPHGYPAQARQMLRKLLDGQLRCEPFEEDGRRGYRFSATGTYSRLFTGAAREGGGPNGIRTRVSALRGRKRRSCSQALSPPRRQRAAKGVGFGLRVSRFEGGVHVSLHHRYATRRRGR